MYRSKGTYVDKEQIEICCEDCKKYKRNFDNVTIFEELKKLQKLKEDEENE